MTRDEHIALLNRAADRVMQEEDTDLIKASIFGTVAGVMEHYPDHVPDGLETLLYMAENVEDWISSYLLIKKTAST